MTPEYPSRVIYSDGKRELLYVIVNNNRNNKEEEAAIRAWPRLYATAGVMISVPALRAHRLSVALAPSTVNAHRASI